MELVDSGRIPFLVDISCPLTVSLLFCGRDDQPIGYRNAKVFRRAGLEMQTGLSVYYQFGRGAGIGRDHRSTAIKSFDDHHTELFKSGSRQHQGGAGTQFFDDPGLILEAQVPDVRAFPGRPFDFLAKGAVPDDLQRTPILLERIQKDVDPFFGREPADKKKVAGARDRTRPAMTGKEMRFDDDMFFR